jgi:uncharacterized protein YaaR (DUF327 family)
MTEEENTAVVTEPESETESTEQFDLTSMFMEESESQPEVEEATEQSTEEDESEPEEDDILLQSNEEDEESEEQVPKSVQKLLKQVNKLTARAKYAEEQLQDLQSQKIASGETGEALSDIHSLQDLQKYKETAMKAKKFALKNINKDYVEHNGEEYDSERISSLLEEADEALTELIPERERFIKQRDGVRQQAGQIFPWLSDEESPITQAYQYGRNLPDLAPIHKMANAEIVFGLMAEGYASRMARQQAMSKAKAKKKPEPPKAVNPTSAPPKRQVKDKTKILGNGNVDLKTFSQFLEQEE